MSKLWVRLYAMVKADCECFVLLAWHGRIARDFMGETPIYTPQLQSALAPCQLVWDEPKFCELKHAETRHPSILPVARHLWRRASGRMVALRRIGDLISKLVHP